MGQVRRFPREKSGHCRHQFHTIFQIPFFPRLDSVSIRADDETSERCSSLPSPCDVARGFFWFRERRRFHQASVEMNEAEIRRSVFSIDRFPDLNATETSRVHRQF